MEFQALQSSPEAPASLAKDALRPCSCAAIAASSALCKRRAKMNCKTRAAVTSAGRHKHEGNGFLSSNDPPRKAPTGLPPAKAIVYKAPRNPWELPRACWYNPPLAPVYRSIAQVPKMAALITKVMSTIAGALHNEALTNVELTMFNNNPSLTISKALTPRLLAMIPTTAPTKDTPANTANKALFCSRFHPRCCAARGARMVSIAASWTFAWNALKTRHQAPEVERRRRGSWRPPDTRGASAAGGSSTPSMKPTSISKLMNAGK
mmetsp:Transcript_133517/g.345607  ORF Transcript_133517/g.345607 Transcript_133517/m.345607 type:complete len:264 (+) Transcript_133517:382-1173(+)